jgi:hypothetical protein
MSAPLATICIGGQHQPPAAIPSASAVQPVSRLARLRGGAGTKHLWEPAVPTRHCSLVTM